MKPITILALVATTALGGVVFLFFEVQDLRDQLAFSRAGTAPKTAVYDHLSTETRLDRLEERFANLSGPDVRAEAPRDTRTVESEGLPVARAGTDGAAPAPSTVDDEQFRERVERATEQNRRKRRLDEFGDVIDRLVSERRIGTLTDAQKKKVGELIMAAREELPDTIRGIMRSPENRELPREERFALVQTEVEKVRAEVATEIEGASVPAADATVIADEALSFGPGMGRRRNNNRR